MLSCLDIIGKQIINCRNQTTSYNVADILFQRRELKVIALRLNTTKKSKTTLFLPLRKIIDVNERGVIIQQVGDIVKLEEAPSLAKTFKEFRSIIGFEVYSATQDLLGIVKNYKFDLRTGEIMSFVISEGFFTDITSGYSLLPPITSIDYGKKAIVMAEGEELLISSSTGGLKKLLGIDDRI